jgi:hypothetical protein
LIGFVLQLFLLALPPTSFVTTLFRMHFSLLSGALLAIVFPVTASRQFPFEVHVYWIQHCIMLAVPIYLLSLGGEPRRLFLFRCPGRLCVFVKYRKSERDFSIIF